MASESPETLAVPPFTVAELIASALDAFMSAAALHLGETLPDGRSLPDPNPREAWFAVLAASALVDQLGPHMRRDMRMPFETGLQRLLNRFAELNPDEALPAPGLPVGSLREAVAAAWRGIETPPPEPPRAIRPATGPLEPPGTKLPTRGSGPLFPPP